MNTNTENNPNGVNERTGLGSQLSPGSELVDNQASHGRHPITGHTRRKYARDDNRAIMECYYRSKPESRGYRKRMHTIWKERDMFDISEQRLVDQARTIIKKEWFTSEELDEIKRYANIQTIGEQNESIRESITPSSEESLEGIMPVEIESSGSETQGTVLREPLTDGEKQLVEEILQKREEIARNRQRLRTLRHIERTKIMAEVKKLDKVLDYVRIDNITEMNDTIMACATLVTEKLGKKRKDRDNVSTIPAWKVRLQNKIKILEQDLSRVVESQKRFCNDGMRKRMEKKYNIKRKGYTVVIEEMKQNLKATSQKIKRYTERVRQYNENRMFVNNQKQFYQSLQKAKENQTKEPPEREATREFWQGIWSESTTHNRNAEWIKRVQEKLSHVERQENLDITAEDVKQILGKVPNWKAPGPDGVQGFWIKNLKSLYKRIAQLLQGCLNSGNVPKWMTTGKTVLIMKDPTKGNHPGNYRPITCLPLMWKALTGIIADKLYVHMEYQQVI